MLNKKRVLSGMRPTGRLHLGNYLGAAKGMIELQDNPDYETFYMVADVHGITTPFNPKELKESRMEVILDYLAAGLDPKKATIFIQSQVPQHLEFAAYLSSVMTVARLQHLPTFKEKVKQYPENVTMALLNYPILMASDILIYKSDKVPVGVDQEPHIEISREIARKMNSLYGTSFPEPVRFATKGGNIPSLLGEGKMAKSVEGSSIFLTDDLETIKKRLAKVPTDSGKGNKVPTQGPVANLLKFVELFQGEEKRKEYESLYIGEGIRYGDLKAALAQAIFEELKPIQDRRREIAKDMDSVYKMLDEGAKRAQEVTQKVVDEVKEKMGFLAKA